MSGRTRTAATKSVSSTSSSSSSKGKGKGEKRKGDREHSSEDDEKKHEKDSKDQKASKHRKHQAASESSDSDSDSSRSRSWVRAVNHQPKLNPEKPLWEFTVAFNRFVRVYNIPADDKLDCLLAMLQPAELFRLQSAKSFEEAWSILQLRFAPPDEKLAINIEFLSWSYVPGESLLGAAQRLDDVAFRMGKLDCRPSDEFLITKITTVAARSFPQLAHALCLPSPQQLGRRL
jgi:hypothetical protein